MKDKQLNRLVISYQETGNEETFSAVFAEVSERWRKTNTIRSLARKYQLHYNDVDSLAIEKLFDVVRKYKDSGNFYNMLSVALSRGCIDMCKKEKKHSRHIPLEFEEDDEDLSVIEFLVCANAEDEAIELLQRKSDQRQLIAQLLDKAPPKSRQAVRAYVESGFSYTGAAKLLGTEHAMTVKRQIEGIAKHFDANQNGCVYDYFSV